jgi:hypothetical protein
MQWGWNYFTRNRSARLITHQTETHDRQPDTEFKTLTVREESDDRLYPKPQSYGNAAAV